MSETHNRVLVIDDNGINRKYLRSVLSNGQMNPIITSGGQEALDYLKENEVDLILIDIQMPEMDGFECFTRIKSDFDLNCPIIAITAFSGSGDKERIISFGFNDYIMKPVKPNVLIETIRYWISNFDTSNLSSFSIEREHIDHEVINELLRFTGRESLLNLIEEFVSETISLLQSIAILKNHNKYTEILSILHTIKGNAGSFGFAILSNMAASIEIHIREGKLDNANLELEAFLEYADTLLRDYTRLLKIN